MKVIMQEHSHITSGTMPGTVSGTVLTVVNIGSPDIIKTVILAVLGAMVSFVMTVFLKWLSNKMK